MRYPWVIEIPGDHALTEDDVQRLAEQVRAAIDGAETGKNEILIPTPGIRIRRLGEGTASAQMDRLLALLALSPQERSFVQNALDAEGGKDFWGILADYLEEKQNPNAGRFRDVAHEQVNFRGGPAIVRRPPTRAGVLHVSPELLLAALHLPEQTRVHNAAWDLRPGPGLYLVVEHPDLPEVWSGNPYPAVDAIFSDVIFGQAEDVPVFERWQVREF